MHPAALDLRNREARQRITAAAAALSDALAIPALVRPTAVELRQPPVAQMRELEGIADVLEAVTRALLTEQESHPIGNTEERPGSRG